MDLQKDQPRHFCIVFLVSCQKGNSVGKKKFMNNRVTAFPRIEKLTDFLTHLNKKMFKPRLMFIGKARSLPYSRVPETCFSQTLLTNIKLG